MASNNPDITASDIISDIESRLGSPNISGSIYLPWISHGYQKLYHGLANAGQEVKENLFGALETITLANGTSEYSIEDNIPRYGGLIKAEIRYGGSEDQYVRATKLRSLSQWNDQSQVSTEYRAKVSPLIYFSGTIFGVIPTPPATDAGSPTLKVWYIKRPYQITSVTDVVDIPYRFLFPVTNYVQAKAIQHKYEDYSAAAALENKFDQEVQMAAEYASGEITENEGMSVEYSSGSELLSNPLRTW